MPKYQLCTYEQTKGSLDNVKLVVVGDGGCGKTCLLLSYSQGTFPDLYVPTVFENYVTPIKTPNGKFLELALWDTAGQEEYDRLRPLSYPDTDVLLLCFAINNGISLENIVDNWVPEVSLFCPGVPLILVGLKSDLRSTTEQATGGQVKRFVTNEEALDVAKRIGAIQYIECSALKMDRIDEVFDNAIDIALDPSSYTQTTSTTSNKAYGYGNAGQPAKVHLHSSKPSGNQKESNSDSKKSKLKRFDPSKPKKKKKGCLIL